MASAHIIEVGGRAAGIVIREHGGFRFFASERAFQALEGGLFRTIDQAARARQVPEAARPRFTHPTGSGLMRRNRRTRRWIGTALFETVGLVVGLTPRARSRRSYGHIYLTMSHTDSG